ncbi:hypothetical protein M9H77_07295 [Catharanthus roseus]|uniref:Uncharacterized protein n=1 Tax=Catharanthus roseus TaxID=4058 RepID=A0ACC0BUJ6_CATRO|nr:hypothetical protein M9H77_07295 [Catharanthus roseus]
MYHKNNCLGAPFASLPPVASLRHRNCRYFVTLMEKKEHERKTTGAPMPTDHELMLELNEGLKKGYAYGFGAAESALLRTQSQHATVAASRSLVVMRTIWPPSVARSLVR